jgi:hypothetical protein
MKTPKKRKPDPEPSIQLSESMIFRIDEYLRTTGIRPTHSTRSWLIRKLLLLGVERVEKVAGPLTVSGIPCFSYPELIFVVRV